MADTIEETAEQILGQFYYATGAGAGHHWINRAAVARIRLMYLPPILRALKAGRPKWDDQAPYVLHYMETIGRVAATLSAAEGRHVIEDPDVAAAIRLVEDRYDMDRPEGVDRGAWCDRP